jgi:hypothetical protein
VYPAHQLLAMAEEKKDLTIVALSDMSIKRNYLRLVQGRAYRAVGKQICRRSDGRSKNRI